VVWPQNHSDGFHWFGLKTSGDGFLQFGLKITTTVSWFGPQNQSGFSLLVALQNRWREVGARHTLRSSGLLGVKASLARVSQSGLKTGEGATAGGTRGTIAEVASETSLRWTGRCDRLRWILISYLCCFQYIRP
jgi:hypothetical protein